MLVIDGLSDEPHPDLSGETPLSAARTLIIDRLAKEAEIGRLITTPEGLSPGSDVGHFSLLGYDPRAGLPGRAAIEAEGIGLKVAADEVVYRLNLVSLSGEGGEGEGGGGEGGSLVMRDFSGGGIGAEAACGIIADLNRAFGKDGFAFYPGARYRNLLVFRPEGSAFGDPRRRGGDPAGATAPHEIVGEAIAGYLPRDPRLSDLVLRSIDTLAKYPIRAVWPWAGSRPIVQTFPSFLDRFGLRGAMISAVPLVRGIGRIAGLQPIQVEGATGDLDSDFLGKGRAAVGAFDEFDFVYLHVQAPDERAHQGDADGKVRAIEEVDLMLGRILGARHDLNLLLTADHGTSTYQRRHMGDPVPYLAWPAESPTGVAFSETAASVLPAVSPAAVLERLLSEMI